MRIWGKVGARVVSEADLWETTMIAFFQRRRLMNSPAEPNESLKLELPWAWEPDGS